MIDIRGSAQVLRARARGARRRPVDRARRGGRRRRAERFGQEHGAALHQRARDRRPSGEIVRRRHTTCTGKKADLDAVRAEVGMVFQQFNLFPHLTVLEQHHAGAAVGAQAVAGARPRSRRARATRARRHPREGGRAYPRQLSGGQQQRVAIARALAMDASRDAVRRTDLRARSRDDQGGARRHARARAGRHDDGGRHARDGLRPRRGRPRGLHGRGPHRRGRLTEGDLRQPAHRARHRASSSRSSATEPQVRVPGLARSPFRGGTATAGARAAGRGAS